MPQVIRQFYLVVIIATFGLSSNMQAQIQSPQPVTEGKQMSTNSKDQAGSSSEQRLKQLDIKLPAPPEPFGSYVEAVQTGNLLFLSGMLPTEGHSAKIVGRVGAEL